MTACRAALHFYSTKKWRAFLINRHWSAIPTFFCLIAFSQMSSLNAKIKKLFSNELKLVCSSFFPERAAREESRWLETSLKGCVNKKSENVLAELVFFSSIKIYRRRCNKSQPAFYQSAILFFSQSVFSRLKLWRISVQTLVVVSVESSTAQMPLWL